MQGSILDHLSPFCDIHCHLLPGLDDGARDERQALAMAELAVADGIGTIVATPHQLGAFPRLDGRTIREAAAALQQLLDQRGIPLRILPGGELHVEPELIARLREGHLLSLADQGRHVLLELPAEVCLPLGRVLGQLDKLGCTGILAHPERNQALLAQPRILEEWLAAGCLVQVTAGSLLGTFGPHVQAFAERLVQRGQVHFVASDAHGPNRRRPLLRRAFERIVHLADESTAVDLCCRNPANVVAGRPVEPRQAPAKARRTVGWLSWRKAS